ncbi:hypothetical protein Tco_0096977 [Tanacetum coccineum]
MPWVGDLYRRSLYRSQAWYNVSSPSCLKLRISSSCLAVFDGGQYLWIKAFLRRSQESTVPGGSLSTYLLAAPVREMGKTRSMTASCDTPGMLNKLTICNGYSEKDKNQAKTGKTEHGNEKSAKSLSQSQSKTANQSQSQPRDTEME